MAGAKQEDNQGPSYSVFLDPRAARDLDDLERDDRKRVEAKIDALAADPRPQGVEKLKGQEGNRVRVGNWRIIYLIDDQAKRVLISRVKRRDEKTYR